MGGPVRPRVVHHEVRIANLDPRHDGVKIAQLSDIHVGDLTPAAHIRAAIDAANEQNPDLIVLTGDYVCWKRSEVALAAQQLGGLRAPRVLAVLGNHDYFVWGAGVTSALERNGYEVLRNQTTIAHVRGAPLAMIGVDDPITRHHDLDASFAGTPSTMTRVVLCHSPDHAPEISRRGADLVMSGHTHGGQMFVKGITDRLMRRAGLNYRRGFFEFTEAERKTTLYVTPGVGFSGVTRRFGEGTHAEVAVLTLRPALREQVRAAAG
ncbi:MAG: metallophosphoesterase [Deltaproteobacteria bacterium]|nr:metallophosphoesterase [Deltaproteobacteria bacterium]